MADVYVNALTTISTEPTTTDSIVAVNRNTNEGKIIDYNKLADVILDKLTSKQYSGLNTTSKLLVGAINELDSDISSSLETVNIESATRVAFSATSGNTGNISLNLQNDGYTIVTGVHASGSSTAFRVFVAEASNSFFITAINPNTGATVNNAFFNIRYLLIKLKQS